MTKLTQKYVIVQFSKSLPVGYTYSMKGWPLHVTLADVFSINGKWTDLFKDMNCILENEVTIFSKAIVKDLFGEDRSIKVTLIEKTDELQNLHERVVSVLEKHGALFNSPEYTKDGFKPHATEQAEAKLEIGDVVEFGSLTLVDMFPDGDPYQRKILGTVHLR